MGRGSKYGYMEEKSACDWISATTQCSSNSTHYVYACTPVICSNFHHLNLRRTLNKEKEERHVFVLQMRAASSVMTTVLTEADCNLMLQVTDINLQKCLLNEDDFLK